MVDVLIVVAIVLGSLIVAAAVLLTVCGSVLILRSHRLRVIPFTSDKGASDPRVLATIASHRWAAKNGYEFVGYFRVAGQRQLMAAWQRRDRPVFLCQRVQPGMSESEFTTVFADEAAVETSSCDSAVASPRPPGRYAQSFVGMGRDELWRRHVEAEEYLIAVGRARPGRLTAPFEVTVTNGLRKEGAYLRRLRLWPLRLAYWFFVRPRFWRNRSIQQQHERGMIRLPNELQRDGWREDDSLLMPAPPSAAAAPAATAPAMGSGGAAATPAVALLEALGREKDPARAADQLEAIAKKEDVETAAPAEPAPDAALAPEAEAVTAGPAPPEQAEVESADLTAEEEEEAQPEEPEEIEGVPIGTIKQVETELAEMASKRKNLVTALVMLVLSVVAFVALGLFAFSFWTIAVLVLVIFIHELGHSVGMRLAGYRDVQVMFIPLLGAATMGTETRPTGEKKAVVTLLGPVPGLVIGAVLGMAFFQDPRQVLKLLASAFVFLNLFNLLPLHPFDGGRLLENAFLSRYPKAEAVFKLLPAAALALVALAFEAPLLALVAVTIMLGIWPAYRTAKIAARLRGQIPEAEAVAVDRIGRDHLAKIISVLSGTASAAPGSAKLLAQRVRAVWQRICNRPPAAAAAVGLLLLYLWSVLFGLICLMFVIGGAEHAQDAAGRAVPSLRDARILSRMLITFLVPIVQIALSWRLWTYWHRRGGRAGPLDGGGGIGRPGRSLWGHRASVLLFWAILPILWVYNGNGGIARLFGWHYICLGSMTVTAVILAAVLVQRQRPRPAGRAGAFVKAVFLLCWLAATLFQAAVAARPLLKSVRL